MKHQLSPSKQHEPNRKRAGAGHESFDRTDEVSGSSDRVFGFVFTALFTIIGALPLAAGKAINGWSLVLALLFLALAILRPAVLAPLNRAWMKFGLLLHRIVSPLVLGIMFFLVITPTGLLMRLFGKNPLRLKFNATDDSYWIDRSPPGPPSESLKDQF